MLKYKSYTFASIANNVESLTDILAGMSGKNRRIVSLAGTIDAGINLRVYRDAEQIVDIACDIPTTTNQWVAMDLPLAEGQLCKAGFNNVSAGAVTPTIVIGYEETG